MILASVIIALLAGCAEEEEVTYLQEVYDYERDSVLVEGYQEELTHVKAAIWESFESYKIMSLAGFKYNNQYCLAPAKLSQYSTNKQKALGMGACCAYVSYATVNGQHQDAMNGLNAVMRLADQLQK